MRLSTFVYQQYIRSSGMRRRFWYLVRKLMIKLLNDPICSLPIHGKNLKFHLSHSLPDYLSKFPFYDRLPQRISEYVHKKQGYLNCIDVGANIGDTIASFYKEDTDIFLAIEPNPKFNKLLSENWCWNKNITILSDIVSDGNEEDFFTIKEKNGTASLIYSEGGIKMKRRSLDEILDHYPHSKNINILKIDTDGHDFEIIRGAKGLLSKNLPIVLFECDFFENTNYVEDCIEILKVFEECGYKYFLVYSNYGELMGKHLLSNLSPFRDLLFYQLTSSFYYFDILVMEDDSISEFYKEEINYFTQKMLNTSLQKTAISAPEPSI